MGITLHPRVLELLSSRICHDLVSPVGAVNNGIELMREMGTDMADDALDLIESSVGQAAARLKLFRLAYGAAGSEKQVSFQDLQQAFEGWISAGRNNVEWASHVDLFDAPKGLGKVVLNLLVLAEECNPGDGTITVTPEDDGSAFHIHIQGKRPSFHEGMEACLAMSFPVEELDPRLVHAYVTGGFIQYFNLDLTHEQISETEMSFHVKAA